MARSKNYKGDGLIFAKAVADKPFSLQEVMQLLNISKGTVYNYYETERMDNELKKKIAHIFDKSPK